MEVSIKNLQFSYVAGDSVECILCIKPKRFSLKKKSIISTDVYLARREFVVQEGGTYTDSNGKTKTEYPHSKTDHLVSKSHNDSTMKTRLQNTKVSGEVTEDMVFQIPRDATNSSSGKKGIGPENFKIDYGVIVNLKMEGNDVDIKKFFKIKVNPFLPTQTPKWFNSDGWMNDTTTEDESSDDVPRENNVRLLTKSNSSVFAPGEKIQIEFALVKKTVNPILWVTMKFTHTAQTYTTVVRNKVIQCTVLYDKDSSSEEDYALLEKTINEGGGTKFEFKIPETMMGNANNSISTDGTVSTEIKYTVTSLLGKETYVDRLYYANGDGE